MGRNRLDVKDICLLHLTRNAPSLLVAEEGQPNPERKTRAHFSMFDYFDWLEVIRDDTLDHISCLGLDFGVSERSVPSISSQYLTLVTLEGERESFEGQRNWGLGDPFFAGPDRDDCLRDLPFLSVMMVTVLPDPSRKIPRSKFPPQIGPEDVDRFLKGCADELRNIVWEACQDTYKTTDVRQAVFQVYHCINSGNFCIALRSRTPELTYHVSLRVRAATLNQDHKHSQTFPMLDCSTFSLLGAAYVTNEDGAVDTPSHETVSASTSKVALRLSVTNKVRNNLFQHAPQSITEELSGLYGRYDVTLRLEMEQFWRLYPWICAHKLGGLLKQTVQDKDSGDVVVQLQNAMMDHGAQCINARLLVHVDGQAPDNNGGRRKMRQENVQKENQDIAKQIKQCLQRAEDLPYCQEEYQECLQLLRDLWESYSSLRYQDDSFINGNMLLAQMSLLLCIVESYIDSIDPDTPLEQDYQTLIDCLKQAINSISHFQKMMLSINQQSLQAPNYEVQMHTDMEKFVVAYTEFSRRFLAEHFLAKKYRNETDPLERRRQKIFPMITVDMVRESIQAVPLFLLPYRVDPEQGLIDSNRHLERILLSIEVPDSDSFGNLYATLPLICHELFHNFRVMDRDKRNEALAKFILHKVAQHVVHQWISDAGDGYAYTAFGEIEDQLFVDKLEKELYRAYQERFGEICAMANIGALTSNILVFLADDIFTLRDRHTLYKAAQSPEEVEKQLKQLYSIAFDASGGATPEWNGDYQDCLDFLNQLIKKLPKVERRKAELTEEERQGIRRLPSTLESLSRKMVTDIFSWHLERVMKAGNPFSDQVKELIDPENDCASAFRRELLDALYVILEEGRAAGYILQAPTLIDQWVGRLYTQRTVIKKKFRRFESELRRHGISEDKLRALSFSELTLDYTIRGFCHAVKDSSHLALLLCSCQYYEEQLVHITRDRLLRCYHDAIRMELEYYYENRETPHWILYSAPQIQELTAPLGGDLEQSGLFFQSLRQVFSNITKNYLFSLVNDSTTLYREVFADLGMCVCLQLNTFGYLCVLARNDIFCKSCRDSTVSNMRLERMRLVSQLLMEGMPGNSKEKLEQLRKDLLCCFEERIAVIEQDMSPEGRLDEDWKSLRNRMEALMKRRIRAGGVAAFTVKIRKFERWMNKEGKDNQAVQGRLMDQYQQVRSLWNLAHLANYLIETFVVGAGHFLNEHFTQLLAMIRTEWEREADMLPKSDVLDLVGGIYNDPHAMGIPKRGRQMFKHTLSFVLYYYYHSWNVYGHNYQEKAGRKAWLEALMGGDES